MPPSSVFDFNQGTTGSAIAVETPAEAAALDDVPDGHGAEAEAGDVRCGLLPYPLSEQLFFGRRMRPTGTSRSTFCSRARSRKGFEAESNIYFGAWAERVSECERRAGDVYGQGGG